MAECNMQMTQLMMLWRVIRRRHQVNVFMCSILWFITTETSEVCRQLESVCADPDLPEEQTAKVSSDSGAARRQEETSEINS